MSSTATKERRAETAATGEERIFWHVMIYGCDQQEFHSEVYLEEGCEGPRDRATPGDEVAVAWWETASGRHIVPVPMFAFRCPNGHHMQHIRWNEDRDLVPRRPESELPTGVRRFHYPSRADLRRFKAQACGVPIQPEEGA